MKKTDDVLGGKGTVKKKTVGCGQERNDHCWSAREDMMENCNEWEFRTFS